TETRLMHAKAGPRATETGLMQMMAGSLARWRRDACTELWVPRDGDATHADDGGGQRAPETRPMRSVTQLPCALARPTGPPPTSKCAGGQMQMARCRRIGSRAGCNGRQR